MFKRLRGESPESDELSALWETDTDRYVPASARNSERLRIARYLGEEPVDDDEDLQFIAELAREARRNERPLADPPRAGRPLAAPHAVSDDDEDTDDARLQVFRELPRVYERPAVLAATRVPDIDLGELLDSLQTTAAALRLRRAA
jgi:hypothetical protein